MVVSIFSLDSKTVGFSGFSFSLCCSFVPILEDGLLMSSTDVGNGDEDLIVLLEDVLLVHFAFSLDL